MLPKILTAPIFVGRFTYFIRLKEYNLRYSFISINFGGQRCGVRKLQRHIPLPLGLERGYVNQDAAIMYEDTCLERKISCLGNGQAIYIMLTWNLAYATHSVIH